MRFGRSKNSDEFFFSLTSDEVREVGESYGFFSSLIPEGILQVGESYGFSLVSFQKGFYKLKNFDEFFFSLISDEVRNVEEPDGSSPVSPLMRLNINNKT